MSNGRRWPLVEAPGRALAKQPADRFATATQFVEALAAAPGSAERRVHRALRYIAAAVVLVVLGVSAVIARNRRMAAAILSESAS